MRQRVRGVVIGVNVQRESDVTKAFVPLNRGTLRRARCRHLEGLSWAEGFQEHWIVRDSLSVTGQGNYLKDSGQINFLTFSVSLTSRVRFGLSA